MGLASNSNAPALDAQKHDASDAVPESQIYPKVPRPAALPAEAMAFIARSSSAQGSPQPPKARRSSAPPPIARFARYDIHGRLAVGGMSEIYLGAEAVAGGAVRHVAIKVLTQQVEDADTSYFEELFLREGRVAVQLVHPNICHVYEFGKWGGHYFIAMEWIDGVSLHRLLHKLAQRPERLAPPLAAMIASQVAGALEHAHTAVDTRRRRLGVVHRDVNPQNIMLRYDGAVKLVDFGVAQMAEQEDSRSNTVKGKFAYMAPEQLAGKPLDGRADVFALGVCLYEMLTGLRLFKREHPNETMSAVLHEPARSVRDECPDVPEELDRIVQQALAKNAESRFADAASMQSALDLFLARQGEVVSARRIAALLEDYFPNARSSGPMLAATEEVAAKLRPLVDHPIRSSSITPDSALESLPVVSRTGAKRVALLALCLALIGMSWMWLRTTPDVTPKTSVVRKAEPAIAPPVEKVVTAPSTQPAQPIQPDPEPEPETIHEIGHPLPAEPLSAKRRHPSPGFVENPGF